MILRKRHTVRLKSYVSNTQRRMGREVIRTLFHLSLLTKMQ